LAAAGTGLWISKQDLRTRPTSGAAWTRVQAAAMASCGTPNLENQDDPANVCVMAKALVAARTNQPSLTRDVAVALASIANDGSYSGRALSLGRELGAYVIAADLIGLAAHDPSLDAAFRTRIRALLTTPTIDGPSSLVECHEDRPNNWGTHCGASRAAVAVYLKDDLELARVAQVFKGWLGDRGSYAGFRYGNLAWQCNPVNPVGVNPINCTILGRDVDGVIPDDERRSGGFMWPPPKDTYGYESLQGALAQAVILDRAGYDAFAWQDRALLRAYTWLNVTAGFAPEADDAWETYVVNFYYGRRFRPVASRPGKNVGWTDWTHVRRR
jgi:hypothetical protein